MSANMLWDPAPSAHATFVFAHGAGLPMDAPFMQFSAQALSARGVNVLRFEFPYMRKLRDEGKRSPPNPMPVLEASFREAVASAPRAQPLFIGGKSMGGRVATQLADELGVRGVIALGYPFHPPKQPEKLRVEHLSALRTPCLIVQGTRDDLGSAEEVAGYALSPNIRLHWLADGDHSFEPRKASGRTLEQNMAEAVAAIVTFTRAAEVVKSRRRRPQT